MEALLTQICSNQVRCLKVEPTGQHPQPCVGEAPSLHPVWTLRGSPAALWWTHCGIAAFQPKQGHRSPPGKKAPGALLEGPETLTKGLPTTHPPGPFLRNGGLASFWGTLSLQLLDLRLKKTRLDFKLGDIEGPTSLLVFWVIPARELFFQFRRVRMKFPAPGLLSLFWTSVTLSLHRPNLCLKKIPVATTSREVRCGILLTACEWEGMAPLNTDPPVMNVVPLPSHSGKQQIFVIQGYLLSDLFRVLSNHYSLFTLTNCLPAAMVNGIL